MRLGIVGSEGSRWKRPMDAYACRAIRELCEKYEATTVVSGACSRGGIDVWAAEHARFAGLELIEHEPEVFAWLPPGGYRERNLRIVRDSDRVVAIAPALFGKWKACYHCAGDPETKPHVVNGGCWTARQSSKFTIVVVEPSGYYHYVEREK